ncbi:hypothetical protein SLEP1_g42641 [Rubroshorea leprosula]|uniref:Uncharacterized protein n=1 Tax=Rubroshorea leprosula TaxID=152421 RepID=A0AAV5LAJ8_9ROSI|nr:hypothetical protein SLEP1_g42641 [Rubroshorea leprosula]
MLGEHICTSIFHVMHVDFQHSSDIRVLDMLHRLAREADLEYVGIQNLTEFYDDDRDIKLLFDFYHFPAKTF